MAKNVFKAVLAVCLLLILSAIPASAQSVTAQTCVNMANLFGTLVQERNEGVPYADQLKELTEAVEPDHPLRAFLFQKLKETRQTKLSPQDFAEAFAKQCFAVRGDISQLMGKPL